MNLSYLFKMRFFVLFTYFTVLLQKTIVCNIFLLQSTKKTPQKLDFICLTFGVQFINNNLFRTSYDNKGHLQQFGPDQ